MPAKPVYVLGTGLSHDGSACLLKDGRIAVAIEKERLTRRKHDGFNDTAAIRYCLEAEGIALRDVSLVVQNANFGMFAAGNNWFDGSRLLDDSVCVATISHHLAHAYSAVGTCPFDESAVLVIDGCGNSMDECIDLDGAKLPEQPPHALRHGFYEKDSFYAFRGETVTPVYKDFSCWGHSTKQYPMHPGTTMHSIGGLYQAVSSYVFGGMDDSGKLMGLAPYGRPGAIQGEIFELRDGRAFVRYDWMQRFIVPVRNNGEFKKSFQSCADLAFWVQKEVERAILYVITSRYSQVPSSNLCYTGGVALNAVANGRILRETPYRRIYIQPAAGDNGLAIGCAYYGWMHLLGKPRQKHDGSPFLGAMYGKGRIERTLEQFGTWIEPQPKNDSIEKAAELLAEGRVLGWFQGGSEFGPRALGHRSILADPRRGELRDYINRNIKLREDFRPFAPSVLAEDLHTHFEALTEDPYMLTVVRVRPELQSLIPSVVHADGSARIQTVSEHLNPGYYHLLQRFKKCTGIGVLLNTSLNRRGMPIVETPEQAVNFFLGSGLDALVLEGQLILRKAQNPPSIASPIHKLDQLFQSQPINGPELEGSCQMTVQGSRTWSIDFGRRMVSSDFSEESVDTTIILSQAELQVLSCGTLDEVRDAIRAGRIDISGKVDKAVEVFRLLQQQCK